MDRHELTVLGPTTLAVGGRAVPLRPREAAVLAGLVLRRAPVAVADLASLIWREPPATAVKTLHNHVARIRRVAPEVIQTDRDGYCLHPDVQVDRDRFEQLLATADPARAVADALTAALEGWTGQAFAALPDGEEVAAERARLAELRLSAEELLVGLHLASDASAEGAAIAERLVADHPYRERRWWLLMLARHRSGRRRDALAAFQSARQVLGDGVGLEPGPSLRRLEAQIVADEPRLATLEPLTGIDGPLPAAASPTEPSHAAGPPIIGREREVATIAEALWSSGDDASSPGRHVLVTAEAGMGKTTLARAVHELLRANGAVVLRTHGEATPDGALRPVGRLVDEVAAQIGLAALVDAAGDGLAPLARIATVVPVPADLATAAPVAEALGALLAQAFAPASVVVVIDDAHLIPPSSARALVVAADRCRARLLLLARPGPLPSAFAEVDAQRVALDGLDRTEVGALVTAITGHAIGDDVAEHLRRRSGGNPLLLHEVVTSTAVLAKIEAGAPTRSIAEVEQVSATVAAFTERRLADLSAATIRVLEAASVIGATVPLELLHELVDARESQVAEAVEAAILVPVDERTVAFRHHLIRDAIAALTSAGRLAELHQAAADALERAGGSWDRIAHHRLANAEADPEAAWHACRRAAAVATEQFAYREAAEHLASVIALGHRCGRAGSAEEADATIDRGEALHLAGDPAGIEVLERAAAAAEAAGDHARFGRALLCRCRLGLDTEAGAPDARLVEQIDRALELDLPPATLAELAGSASLLHSLDADPRRCRDLFALAEATARHRAPDALPRVLPYAYLGLAHPDDLDRRADVAEELVAIDDPAARFSGYHQRFSVEVQRGLPGFRASHRQMARLGDRMATPGHRWTVAYNAACVHSIDGDLDAAASAAEESLGVEGIAWSRRLATYGVQLVALRRLQGRLAELAEPVERLVHDQPEVKGWRAVELAVAAASGDLDRAAALADAISADDHAGVPDDYTRSGAALLVVEAVVAIGDPGRIRRSLPLLTGLRGRLSWVGTTTLGSIDLVAARAERALGDEPAARASVARAVALAERMQAPLVRAEAEAELAALVAAG